MAKVEYCVIGYGRFGEQLATQLSELGKNVMIIEKNPDLVDKISRIHEIVIKCDATDINALEDTAIRNVPNAIVATSSIEESIMMCANLKQLGVENIIARAKNAIHERVLKTMGITNVVVPEIEIANKTAIQLVYNLGADITAINKELCWIKGVITNPELVNKVVVNLNLREKYKAIVVSIQRKDQVIYPINNATQFKIGDIVTLVCDNREIKKVLALISHK